MAPRPPHAQPLPGRRTPSKRTRSAGRLAHPRTIRQFARNLANRVWFHLMGRGIVEPGRRLPRVESAVEPGAARCADRRICSATGCGSSRWSRLIMKSQTYQLGATPDPTNADDDGQLLPGRRSGCSRPRSCSTRSARCSTFPDRFPRAPGRLRAAQLPGRRAGERVPEGLRQARAAADLRMRADRRSTTLAQAFQMINGEAVRRKLEDRGNRIGRRLEQKADDEAILDRALPRRALPRAEPGRAAARSWLTCRATAIARDAWEDVAWAMINSKEFLLRH